MTRAISLQVREVGSAINFPVTQEEDHCSPRHPHTGTTATTAVLNHDGRTRCSRFDRAP